MNGQHGFSQPWPRQQSSYNDMKMWQQQLMCRQLQELQKQQSLQQLDQEKWQQTPSSQCSSISRLASLNQFAPVMNGMAVSDVPSHAWHNDHLGFESRISSNSQMFLAGNTNWVQQVGNLGTADAHRFPNGFVLSQDQEPVLRSSGFVPQQRDQSLYGMPVSSNKTFKQYSHIQGASNYSSDMVAKSIGNQVEISVHSGGFNSLQSDQRLLQGHIDAQDDVAVQRFPGKTCFDQIASRNVGNGVVTENYGQLIPIGRSLRDQEFQSAQEHLDWPGNSRDKAVSHVEPATEMVKLDPTEEKILFSADDDSHWNASFGTGDSGGFHRSLLEDNNCLSAFPSIRSGSWSALMQSAVAESSSGDTGIQDEWSGLSFQQKEVSNVNCPLMLIDSGKQQSTWVENFQSASSLTSRTSPLFDEPDASTNDQAAVTFQQSSFRSAYGHGGDIHAGGGHQSLRRLSEDASGQVNKNLHIQLQGNIQGQVQFGINDSWAGQFYGQPSITASAETSLSQQNAHGTCYQQQNMPTFISARALNKMNGWNNNESNEDATSKDDYHESNVQQNQMYGTKGIMGLQRDQDGNMWNVDNRQKSFSLHHSVGEYHSGKTGIGSRQVQSGDLHVGSFSVSSPNNLKPNREEEQHLFSSHNSEYGKHMAAHSSLNRNEFIGKFQYEANNGQVWDQAFASGKITDETYECVRENNMQKGFSDEGYVYADSHPGQTIDPRGFNRGKEAFLAGSRHPSPASGDSRVLGLTEQKYCGSNNFQFHPMGNLGFSLQPESIRHNLNPQTQLQMSPHKFTPEVGYASQSKLSGQAVSNSARDTENQHLFDSQRSMKGMEEMNSRGTISNNNSSIPASSDESAPLSDHVTNDKTSQNMLELLHKVDQSKDSTIFSGFGLANQNLLPERPELAASDVPSDLQYAAIKGVGLHLALPSQITLSHQPVLTHAFSSKTSTDKHSRQFDLEMKGDKSHTCNAFWPLPPMQGSQRENWPHMSSLPLQPLKEACQLNILTNSTPMVASNLTATGHDLEKRHLSSATQHFASDQLVNMPSGIHQDLGTKSKEPFHMRHINNQRSGDMQDEAVASQSGQPSLLGACGQVAPFHLGSPLNAHPPSELQPFSNDMCQPHILGGTSSYSRNSSLVSMLGTASVSQPLCTLQKGAFQAMLQNMWTNASAQQHLSGNLSSLATVPPNISSVSSDVLDKTTNLSQMADDEGSKRAQNTASCSLSSQDVFHGEERIGKDNTGQPNPNAGAQQVPESLSRSRHVSVGNSPTIPSLVQLHQQDSGRLKHEQGQSLERAGHTPLLNAASSTRDIESRRNINSFDLQHPNYSLLQQVQAMKATETELGKRPRGADSGAGAQVTTGKMPQTYIYGYNTVIRVPSDKENHGGNQSPLPSETKMLCFSSEVNMDQNIMKPSQVIGKDVPTQALTGTRFNAMQNHPCPVTSTSCSMGGNLAHIDPHMAPSWFGHYGNMKNEHTLSIFSGLSGTQKTAKAAAQHYFSKASESTDLPSAAVKRSDAIQLEFLQQSSSMTATASDHPLLHTSPEAVNHNLIVRPKKRKTATSDLIPWHKEIIQGSPRWQSISMAQLKWARSANRLTEKVEDETDRSESRQLLTRAHKRLTLTTHLMQQLIPAVPRKILSADATAQSESVMYLVAKLALGDACNGISCTRAGSISSESAISKSVELKTSEMVRNQQFAKIVEGFMRRASMLEGDLSRFEKWMSMTEVRVECQDLERVFIINRFAKFHGRGQSGVDSSSASGKIFPQRYVTALPMPGSVPEGVFCLSL